MNGSSKENVEEDVHVEEEKMMIRWDEETILRYKEDTKEISKEHDLKKESIKEKWLRLKRKVSEGMVQKKIRIKEKEIGYKDWWDRSCSKKKRKVQCNMKHRMCRRWRKGKINKEKYLEQKKMKKLQEEKQ